MDILKIRVVNSNKFSLLFVTCLFIFSTIEAATKTWNLAGGGSWATAGNWSPSGVPANGDDIIIPALTAGAAITGMPTTTLNSLTYTGAGRSALEAAASGNVLTISTSWYVPSGYTVTIGASGARIVFTMASTCSATLDGYCAFDAGNTNRNFTVNGILRVNSTGMLYDPNPSGGSDFYLTNNATLITQKSQGITVTSAANAAGLNFNVAICFGGSYSYATGANYIYTGTTGQLTGAGLNQNTPRSLTVNLSGGNTLTLTASTIISSSLTLTSGKVNLNSNTLTLGTSAASAGLLTRSADFLFNGTFSRWFTTTAIAIPNNSGLFPLGTSSNDYRPLWVGYTSNLTTAGIISAVHTATYPATFIAAAHTDASWGNTLQGVSNAVWSLAVTSLVFNGSTATLRYGGTGFGVNSLSDLDASLVSSVTGTHSASTNANTTIEVNRTNLPTASVVNLWRIGTRNTSASPLPVTLLNFSAIVKGDIVSCDWSTATERNSDVFEIERSKDGINFEAVGKMEAAGTSVHLLNYSIEDSNPYSGISYYRLKEIDFDGMITYSKLVSVSKQNSIDELIVFPNPSQGLFNVSVNGLSTNCMTIEIFNSLGQCIYKSENCNSFLNLQDMADGIYFIQANFADHTLVKKFVLRQ